MARPTLRADKKRKAVSISLRQAILKMAEETGNRSQFFERSVEACSGILELMSDLRSGKATRADVLEEIGDIIDAWDALKDEIVPFTKAKKRRA